MGTAAGFQNSVTSDRLVLEVLTVSICNSCSKLNIGWASPYFHKFVISSV